MRELESMTLCSFLILVCVRILHTLIAGVLVLLAEGILAWRDKIAPVKVVLSCYCV